MSWICPNCSTANEDASEECFVCGMERPTARDAVSAETPDSFKIVYSDGEALLESLRRLFRKRRAEEIPDEAEEGTAPEPEVPEEETHAAEPEPPERSAFREREPRGDRTAATELRSGFAEPWPEHRLVFEPAAIRSKGYVRSEQTTLNGVHGYSFYREDGSSQFVRAETLLLLKMARKA